MIRPFQALKRRAGALINHHLEPRFGVQASVHRRFPFLTVRKVPQPRFLTVRIDITNKCNLRCKMCYFSMDKVRRQPRVEMSAALFEKIARQVFPVAAQVVISAGAEPLISKHFPQMLQITARYAVPYVSFFTNGMLLNRETIATIIRTGVNVITLSFDGATAQTYEAVRRGADFEQVLANIRLLRQMKTEYGVMHPGLYLGVVLMKSNIAELPDLLRLAQEVGASKVTASHLVPYAELGTQDESLTHYPQLANAVLAEARQVAAAIGMPFDAPPDFDEHAGAAPDTPPASAPGPCHWPWDEILIRPDGSVNPCCYWYDNVSLGNFHTQSFRQIWHGPGYTQLRRELETGHLRDLCRKCPEMNARRTEVEVVK